MTDEHTTKSNPAEDQNAGITAITVAGYKSIRDETTVRIRPLTVLAGPSNSGKSSAMQPLLLMKQTLEAVYDPGPLLLNGANVRFGTAEQLFSRTRPGDSAELFRIGLELYGQGNLSVMFKGSPDRRGLDIVETRLSGGEGIGEILMRPDMRHGEILGALPPLLREQYQSLVETGFAAKWSVRRDRCFLAFELNPDLGDRGTPLLVQFCEALNLAPGLSVEWFLRDLIHVPGLRGFPQRCHPCMPAYSSFPGTFDQYFATVITRWQEENDPRFEALAENLRMLNLGGRVEAKRIGDTLVEIHAEGPGGRFSRTRGTMVNVADAGFGLSQALPLLTALLVAKPAQTVFVEQPESHLHPKAQVAMAEILAEAVNRGAHVVVETHSPLILLAIQTQVAEGRFDPDLVKLHWFRLNDEAVTEVSTADMDRHGAFGDWDADFADVELEAESRYLHALSKGRTREVPGT
ncbi:MAG: AAA family ATPase [Thermodesulfobacteriota bacterium]